ncbi:MAG: hypothetical protein ABJN42_09960 [Roseibium sp.]|uniref:hypothetical protein n=1 Tax=Roseibium sp. TaxID=1936156 RepID=UPI003298AA98
MSIQVIEEADGGATLKFDLDLKDMADRHTNRLMQLMEEAAESLPEAEDGMISMFTIGGKRFEIFHSICAAIRVLEPALDGSGTPPDLSGLSQADAAYRKILMNTLTELIREERVRRTTAPGRV